MTYLFAGVGIHIVVWWRGRGAISYEYAKDSIYFIALSSVIILLYSWYKAFWAVYTIMGKDFDNLPDTPETVICLNCREAFPWKGNEGLICSKCCGPLEDLRGLL
jgi:hypothetical protein